MAEEESKEAQPVVLRLPRREIWLDVPEYEAFKIKVWANYPERVRKGLWSDDTAELQAALLEVVREHNGWGDEEGNPYPAAGTAEFWDALPNELAATVIVLARHEAPRVLPFSLASKRRV